MATYTTNLNLKKPDTTDKVSIADINANMDILDEAVSSGGGEVWEEVDLANFPTDWVAGDRVKVQFKLGLTTPKVSNWTSTISGTTSISNSNITGVVEIVLDSFVASPRIPLYMEYHYTGYVACIYIDSIKGVSNWNSFQDNGVIMQLTGVTFNGASCVTCALAITYANSKYIAKMWRLKK